MKIAILITLASACFAGEPRIVTFNEPILLTVFSKGTTNSVTVSPEGNVTINQAK